MHHHHQHQHHHPQAAAAAAGYQGYAGYAPHHQQPHHGHGYSNSVSSTGTAGGYAAVGGQQQPSGSGSQGTSPYMGHGARLPSVGDMGIDAIINRGQGS
jgi:hypothetical protein